MSVTLSVDYKDFMADCRKAEGNTTLMNAVSLYSQFNFSLQAGNDDDKLMNLFSYMM